MNILLIAPSFPYPLTHGGKIRVFNIIKHLSKTHKVSLVCLSDREVLDFGPLSEYCDDIKVVVKEPQWLKEFMRFIFGCGPYNALRYSSSVFRETVSDLLKRKDFDIVQIEFPMMWQYAGVVKDLPIVLDLHNIEYELVRQMEEASGNALKKALYGVEEKRLRRLEENAWDRCDLCFAVSEGESSVIRAHLKNSDKVITVPNGVDLERFRYHTDKKGEKRILFMGSMDYIPTVDSTDYLLKEVLPMITSRINGIKLDIVGRRLGKLRDRVSGEGIELHENVPDIIPFLKKADVLIDPLRIGAGTRLKILEAMAAGTPVVTTSKGCEGINVQNGQHLLIADSPSAFADAVVKLLTDTKLPEHLASNARCLIEESYSWEKCVQKLAAAMEDLVISQGRKR
jgi:glycosyltransferase involved in cell wall biosynthesis